LKKKLNNQKKSKIKKLTNKKLEKNKKKKLFNKKKLSINLKFTLFSEVLDEEKEHNDQYF